MKVQEYRELVKQNDKGEKKSKYKNKKVKIDGHTFDSKKEGKRYVQLALMEKSGVIKNLELQPVFELTPTLNWNGKTLRSMSYKADFKYFNVEDNEWIVEDVKGYITDTYKVKKKVFLHLYGDKYKFIET